eukprot:gene20392-22403_t
MALVNAGISLKCMVGAVSCFLNQNGEISFEITEDSEQECIAMFTFVFDSLNQDLIMTHTSGNFSEEQYFSCMAASREAVKSVFEFQRKSIERYLSMTNATSNFSAGKVRIKMLLAAKYQLNLQVNSVAMGNYLSEEKNLQEASLKVKELKIEKESPSLKIRNKRSNENAGMSPMSSQEDSCSVKRFCRFDENNCQTKMFEHNKKIVKTQYLRKFFKLFDDDVIQDFLWNDGCAKISDKYLLAMVYVFFRRAGLSTKDYTRSNFFAALFLAHDMEEDDEELKHEIFPWALGSKWKSKFPSLISRRDNILKKMKFRCAVSNLTCVEVIGLCPAHPIWQRERQSYHSGATRLYPPEDEAPFSPKGPDGSPIFCDSCKINTNQDHKALQTKFQQDFSIQNCYDYGAYAFHNYHVRQVEIVGYVVSVDVRERRAVYIIDDSTGVISCVKWINNEADKQRFSHFKHGDLLIVRGKIGSFREERQIKIDNMAKQSDLHVEILHWLEAIKFAVNSQKEKDTTKQKTSAHEK